MIATAKFVAVYFRIIYKNKKINNLIYTSTISFMDGLKSYSKIKKANIAELLNDFWFTLCSFVF